MRWRREHVAHRPARPLPRKFGRAKSASGRPVPAARAAADRRSCRTSSWTGKSRAASATRCRWWSTRRTGSCGWPGYGIDEAFRVTDPAQAVIILRLKAVWEALLELDVEESVVLDGARRRRRADLEFLDQVPARTNGRSRSASSCRAVDAGQRRARRHHRPGHHRHHEGQRALPDLRARRSTTASSTS